jgi:hypothetical protein
LATADAVSVVASGAHTFTDAMAGAGVGVVVALGCSLLLDLLASRRAAAVAAGRSYEAQVSGFFHDYVDSGRPGYVFVLRNFGRSIGALVALFRLPCLRVAPLSASNGGKAIGYFLSPQVTTLLSPRSILTRVMGFATGTLILPDEHGQYSLGASKQTLRRKTRSARKLGVHWAAVNDAAERLRLIKLAEDYEKTHPDETYRNEEPDLGWLLEHRLWLVAYSADGNPLLLSVTPIDGEVALLGHFRTIGTGPEQSDARYLMTEVLVEELVSRGVRYLVDGGSLAIPNGIRHFQRMLGFRIVRIRVSRSPRSSRLGAFAS